jgi:hypothetical protein
MVSLFGRDSPMTLAERDEFETRPSDSAPRSPSVWMSPVPPGSDNGSYPDLYRLVLVCDRILGRQGTAACCVRMATRGQLPVLTNP